MTTSAITPAAGPATPGMGMSQSAEIALQEALILGLHTLGMELDAIEELVNRQDRLTYGTADEWKTALRNALIDMLDPSSDNYVTVKGGYPAAAANLPVISLVQSSGGENDSERVAGMLLRESYHFKGPDQELWATREIGCGQTSEVQVGIWSPAPERSWLLAAAVKWALYQQQNRLIERGIHEVTFRESGDAPSEDLAPRVGYVPILSVTLHWTFRSSYRFKVPNRWTARTRTYTTFDP